MTLRLLGTNVLRTAMLANVIGLSAASLASADVIIGDWENGSTDGWIDWGTQAAIAAPKYDFSTTTGVTHGSSALVVHSPGGYNQNLSIKLQMVSGLKEQFFANQQFSIDFSVPQVGDASGYAQVFGLALNAEVYGFHDQGTNPTFTYGFPNGGPQTTTLTWNYAALVDGNTANGEVSPTAGWVEFILATNSDVARDLYFDNAKLGRAVAVGDFNQSGALDAGDIELLFHAQAGEAGTVDATYDVNGDGYVIPQPFTNSSDADYWVQTLAGTRYGDTNIDRKVNFTDLVTLAQNYNKPGTQTWATGSFNNDGVTNFTDLVTLAQNYNFGAADEAGLSALDPTFAADWALAQSLVPEPTTLAALALLAPVGRRRR